MAGTMKRLMDPTTLTTTYTTTLHHPSSSLVNENIRHIHVANRTNSTVTFRLYLGASGANTAGTEVFFNKTVAAYDVYDWYGLLPVTTADYLVGGASSANSLTMTISGEAVAA